MDDNNNNFLDKNTLTAIVLSVLVLVGWQSYMGKKYPNAGKSSTATNQEAAQKTIAASSRTQGAAPDAMEPMSQEGAAAEKDQVVAAVTMSLDFPNFEADLVSTGMGLKNIKLKNYSDRKGQKIEFSHPQEKFGSYATLYQGKPLNFKVDRKSEKHFIGVAQVGQQTLVKEMIFDSENYLVSVSLKSINGQAKIGETFETRITSKVLKVKSSMFTPAYEGTEFFTINDGSEERERLDIETAYSENFEKSSLTSIGTQYFAVALNDHSPTIPKTKVTYDPEIQMASASVFHPAATQGTQTEIRFDGFMGPKKYDILNSLDPRFVQMINYGMFSILSKPMLSMLKWLHNLFGNWGVAIILLTVFIRLLLLPINVSSLKSMKKMQKIQPQLKVIKEKYKDDPQRVNQETMALMKKEKANPIGGCLPMLLQFPVFLALYSVLGQSVELYKSPFIFWIQDLSYQDPFFVLPVAVGALYFVQMSITPQPADPTQAKVMKFIPILFCFFMITVPSGLTLYFFVNTIFGIGQTFIFQREKQKAAA